MKRKIKLGVNVDHIATLRQARRDGKPVVVEAAKLAIAGGADSIVAHLREDRRHIQDGDVYSIRKLRTHFDLEMAATNEMLKIALKVKPDMATIVPEKRQELTTEGGLDVKGNLPKISKFGKKLEASGIRVSLFIDPVESQIRAAAKTGASFIEIHTGAYARSRSKKDLGNILRAVKLAKGLGLKVNAGHGLDYDNVSPVAGIEGIGEFNIGFSIIARSVVVGLKKAVSEMKKLIVLFLIIGISASFSYSAVKHAVKPKAAVAPVTEEAVPDWLQNIGVSSEAGSQPETTVKQSTEEAVPDWLKNMGVSSEPAGTVEATAAPSTQEGIPDWLKNLGISNEASTIEAKEELLQPESSYFKDVPRDHWAAHSVNELVRIGITQGYPDGTFRGAKNISRYEAAVFISKLARAGKERAAENEKLLEELKAEAYKIRYTLDMYKKPPEKKRPLYVDLSSRMILGNIVSANSASSMLNARIGPVCDYRLIASYRQEFDEDTFVRIGMDTMDSARVGGRDLVKDMLEAEAQVVTKSGFGVNMTSGPGLIIHREGAINIFPSEDHRAYVRPNSGIKFIYSPGDLDSAVGYRATAIATDGAAGVNDVYGYTGYKFRKTFMGDVALKYSIDVFSNDLRGTYATSESTINMYEMVISPSRQLDLGMKVGVASNQDTQHNIFAGLSLISRDLFRSGSTIKLFANKIGSDFYGYPVYQAIMGTDLFDKLYQGGTYDLGMEVSQAMNRDLSMRMTADVVTGPTGLYGVDEPNSNMTFELGMDYRAFEDAALSFGLRTFQNPSAATNATSDMLMFGFRYNH